MCLQVKADNKNWQDLRDSDTTLSLFRAASKVAGSKCDTDYTVHETRECIYSWRRRRDDPGFKLAQLEEEFGLSRTTVWRNTKKRFDQRLAGPWFGKSLPPSCAPLGKLRGIADGCVIKNQGRPAYFLLEELKIMMMYATALHSVGDGKRETQVRLEARNILRENAWELCDGVAERREQLLNAVCNRSWLHKSKSKIDSDANLTEKQVCVSKKSLKLAEANQPHYTDEMYDRLDALYK
jgi:hypothetical protein